MTINTFFRHLTNRRADPIILLNGAYKKHIFFSNSVFPGRRISLEKVKIYPDGPRMSTEKTGCAGSTCFFPHKFGLSRLTPAPACERQKFGRRREYGKELFDYLVRRYFTVKISGLSWYNLATLTIFSVLFFFPF